MRRWGRKCVGGEGDEKVGKELRSKRRRRGRVGNKKQDKGVGSR